MHEPSVLCWDYSVIREKDSNQDIGEYYTYGIRATCPRYTMVLHDVSIYHEDVVRMTELFNKHQLSAVHLRESVEDMLP